jgi:NAD(P)-dependent dehydrogenase (short-subunit alcohol dehydrogenase family)
MNSPQPRNALVAGGAGGIGRSLAKRLAEDGYRVTIADVLSQHEGRDLAEEHGAAQYVQADVSEPADAKRSIDESREDGKLHVLVNCMGISPKKNGAKKPIEEISLGEWNDVLRVNVTGPFLLIREAMRHLQDGAAAIVNVVSVAGKLGAGGPEGSTYPPLNPSGAHYAASKAALANLTASVARELAPRGIRCNGVSPGFVGTGMGGSTDPALSERVISQIPLGRSATTEEVVSAIAFLASSSASYITGEVLDVDGGWTTD